MDMWSPLYVAHPSASSERSPVPTTRPFFHVRHVHEHLGAFPGLGVFIGHVGPSVMPDIPQMRADGLTDFHLAQLGPAGPAPAGGHSAGCVRSYRNRGIVTARMSARGRSRRSHARQVTRRAKAESSPPDRPRTALQPVCLSRAARPAAWIVRISSQRFRLALSADGTKGWGSIFRVRARAFRAVRNPRFSSRHPE